MCEKEVVVALPCASIVWVVFLIFCPSCWKLAVWLLGDVPGVNFDFSRLSFHVPSSGLLCASPACGKAVATAKPSKAIVVKLRRFIIILPKHVVGFGNARRPMHQPLKPRVAAETARKP